MRGALLPSAALAWKVDGAALYPATDAFIKGFVDRRELAGTLAADFDGPSTVALSLMHVVIAVLLVTALEALYRRVR